MTTITDNQKVDNVQLTNNKRTLTVTLAKQGTQGQGVPNGGTTGQFLNKISDTDFDTQWTDSTAVVSWGDILGTLSNQTDLQTELTRIEASAVAMAIALG